MPGLAQPDNQDADRDGLRWRAGGARSTAARAAGTRLDDVQARLLCAVGRLTADAEGRAQHARLATVRGFLRLPRYAQRAALVEIGVAAEARDCVVATVNAVVELATSPRKAEHQLRQLERRGANTSSGLRRTIGMTEARLRRTLGSPQRDAERKRKQLRKQVADRKSVV